MSELALRVADLRNTIDRCVRNVTGKRSVLSMHAKEIGYPDVNELNPRGDLTLALITEHPDELLSQYKREAHFLMDVTDE